MKKKLILYVFAMAAFFVSFAQPRGGGMRADRIEAVKIAFMTKYINLSADEAQKFWPTYNAYNNEIKKTEDLSNYNSNTKINQMIFVSPNGEKERLIFE